MSNEFSHDPILVREFLVESEELLQEMDRDMVALESSPHNQELLNRIFRAMHTIKGTSGFLGFEPLVRLGHCAEDVLNSLRHGEIQLSRRVVDALLAARDQLGRMLSDIHAGGLQAYDIGPLIAQLESAQVVNAPDPTETVPFIRDSSAHEKFSSEPASSNRAIYARANPVQGFAQSMRVDVRKLDDLVDLIGELVLERNRLVRLSRDFCLDPISGAEFKETLNQSTARLNFITEELQVAGLRARMMPIDSVFKKFPRLVRDVARSLQKEVELLVSGEDTELDKTMVELVSDPLAHIVRNALDHGLETPDIRTAAGKARSGIIRLEARQEGDQIVILIEDDGAGMDPARITAKAVEKGLTTTDRIRGMNQKEIFEFIFLPGFSTAEKTSDLSGRGVGMDVVRSNLKKLNGSVDIDSRLGRGTTVQLRMPLTLAILPLLLVEAAEEVYGLPLRAVIETASIRQEQVHVIEGAEVLRLRGQTLPLLRLQQICGIQGAGDFNKVVVLGIGEKRIAVLVDRFLGQESTVIKPLGPFLHNAANLAGATISGDGRVRLVLDPASLLSSIMTMNSATAVRSATEAIQ
jgi:two-component system, chemotaxis family, sensor kinase CheA